MISHKPHDIPSGLIKTFEIYNPFTPSEFLRKAVINSIAFYAITAPSIFSNHSFVGKPSPPP